MESLKRFGRTATLLGLALSAGAPACGEKPADKSVPEIQMDCLSKVWAAQEQCRNDGSQTPRQCDIQSKAGVNKCNAQANDLISEAK